MILDWVKPAVSVEAIDAATCAADGLFGAPDDQEADGLGLCRRGREPGGDDDRGVELAVVHRRLGRRLIRDLLEAHRTGLLVRGRGRQHPGGERVGER